MKRPSIIATDKGGGDFTPVPAGVHLAICVAVVDLGLQESQGGKFAGKVQRKVRLTWELPDERIERDGRDVGPAIIGQTYTLSLNEKSTLSKHLESWRGRAFTEEERAGFDVTTVLGRVCQLQVIHEAKNGKTYANIAAVMGLSKSQREAGIGQKQPENALLVYSPDDHDDATFQLLPEFVRKMIAGRIIPTASDDELEGSRRGSDGDSGLDHDDDIPF